MNVQDVIEKALAGNDGIPVTPAEHSVAEDAQVTKLAAALNFIGTNLESSVSDFEQEKSAYLDIVGGTAAGGIGAASSREKMRRAGMSEEEIDDVQTTGGGVLRGAAKTMLGSLGGYLVGGNAGALAGTALGGYASYAGEMARGRKALKRRENAQNQRELEVRRAQQKTASVDDMLYRAAQAGKQALLEKVAEDRINPAKISAGPAASYSGEIMPSGPAVFGGGTMPAQLIAMKAQKVRARINSDMKQFVNNVGDGYNLQGHLNKMNK